MKLTTAVTCTTRFAAVALATLGFAASAFAQTFPSRPITVIMTMAPAGANEILIRSVTDAVSTKTGQRFIINPKPGGLGAVGLTELANSPPDGHTIAMTFTGALMASPLLTKVSYDPVKSFTPILRATAIPGTLIARADFPARDMAELIKLAKAKPGAISLGYGGTATRIYIELMSESAGVKFLDVPFPASSGSGVAPLLGGQVDLFIGDLGTARSMIESGRLKALGVGSKTRFFAMPNIPAIAETVPGYEHIAWFGFLAPAGLGVQQLDWLAGELRAALAQPNVSERLRNAGHEVLSDTPQEFAAYVRDTIPRYASLIQKYNIKE